MLDLIQKEKFIAILRRVPEDKALPAVNALWRGGVRLFEVTFDPTDHDTLVRTPRLISAIRERYPEAAVAAGTVVFPDYVRAAKEAGAGMIVSPGTDEEVMTLTKEAGMLSVPGAFTPSEIMRAWRLGADIVKIFPIEPHNIPYLANILSPLSYVRFLPTGGVNPDTAGTFIRMGAVAVAAGASVLSPAALAANDLGAIEEAARKHCEAVRV